MTSHKILLCCTGSVATIKINQLILSLMHVFEDHGGIEVKVVTTGRSKHFIDCASEYDRESFESVESLKSSKSISIEYIDDATEWESWDKLSDPVVHIELRKWADIMIVAPISANSLAKLSLGICDNLFVSPLSSFDSCRRAFTKHGILPQNQ